MGIRKRKEIRRILRECNWNEDEQKALKTLDINQLKNTLFKMLEDDPSYRTFNRVTETLDRIGINPENDKEKAYYLTAKENWDAVVGLGKVAIKPVLAAVEVFARDPAYLHSGALPRPSNLARLLARFSDDVVEPLLDAAINGTPKIQFTAMWALAIRGEKRVEPILLECLSKNDNVLRIQALGSLGKLGSTKAAEPLLKIVEDTHESQSIRWTAAWALGQIASPDTAAPLIKVLFNDKQYETGRDLRDILVSSVANIKGPAKQLCLEALNDKTLNPDIHIRCNKILARI